MRNMLDKMEMGTRDASIRLEEQYIARRINIMSDKCSERLQKDIGASLCLQ